MLMKNIMTLFFLSGIIFSFFEGVVAAVPAINCPSSTCYVGNCPCTISGCDSGSGTIDVYTIPCTLTPKASKDFSQNSVSLVLSEAKTYYAKVYCDAPYEQSTCTNVIVSSGGIITTTSITTTTPVSQCSGISCRGCTSGSQCTGVGCIWCGTNGPCESSYSNCQTTTTTSTTTTIPIQDCSSYNSACIIECGKTLTGKQTDSKQYFKFTLPSASDVAVTMTPKSLNVDYDLYMTYDGSEPTESNYKCRSYNGIGQTDTCPNPGEQNLAKGTYYAMIKRFDGGGAYDISLTCSGGITTTTTTSGITTTSTTPGGITTTSTTIPIQVCTSSDNPCKINCGDVLSHRSTPIKGNEYYRFTTNDVCDATVRLQPETNADYDLYANADWSCPSGNIVCSENGIGQTDSCSNSQLTTGTHCFKVGHYEGDGAYDLSLICRGCGTDTTTTIMAQGCNSFSSACSISCGTSLNGRSTATREYFKFTLTSTSTVTVSMKMDSGVDYDLFAKWGNSEPTEDDYDCKSSKDMGTSEGCAKTNLGPGTYYLMAIRYQGSGNYDLSLSCESVGGTTTTTTPSQDCSSFSSACNLACGRTLIGSTTGKDYFKFNISSASDVNVKMMPSTNADYDLYVKWSDTEPTESVYDCRSSSEKGLGETCNENSLTSGVNYAMVDYYSGSGNYNISLSCARETTTTTETTTEVTTTEQVEITTATNTTSMETTTTEETTVKSCGSEGYCESSSECSSGYEACSDYDGECEVGICCCPEKVTPPGPNYGLIFGLFLTAVLVVLVYFYIKNKSTITYEKLYKKWSRVLVN